VLIYRSAIICILLLFPFLFKSGEQRLYSIHGYAQGTEYNLRYYSDAERIKKADVDSLLAQVDALMSLYKPDSQINQFNKSEKSLPIDAHFLSVMLKSFEVYKASEGRFDITVAPLVQLWGFGPERVQQFPDSSTVKETLARVGMWQLELDGDVLYKKHPGVTIDLNGIAQGFSVDVIANYLLASGIKSYMVEIGGEVVVHGAKPDGTGFRIGIEGPSPEGSAAVAKAAPFRHILELKEGAVTSSGTFNKYRKYKEGRISHLIDPRTGYPLKSPMISVTVYAGDAMTADGYDNVLMAMGSIEEAMAFADKAKLEAYFIYHRPDGSLADTLTTGFKTLLVD
jgi:thiamine biosynthesis lipoprotein